MTAGNSRGSSAHPSYRIVPHDPDWIATAAEECALIAKTLKIPEENIEHIGSTAVSGLGAKPIIDVMVGVESEVKYMDYVPLLARLGYEHRGETVPGTLYNRKQGPPRMNAHLCVFEGQFWVDKLVFRDYLRRHPATAQAYERLKRQILVEVGQDPPAYNAAKESFIVAVLAEARRLLAE
ncbi:MAG: GrpB family protein [Dehalococcoidia bacterium]